MCRRRGRRRDRQGDHRRLSLLRRQRVLDPHREHDRAAALPALGRRRRAGERAAVRRAVQPAALLGPRRALQPASPAPDSFIGPKRSPLGLSADPGRLPALQERRPRRRRRRDGRRRLRLRSRDPGRRRGRRGGDRARRDQRLRRARRRSAPTGSASTAPRCASATPPSADLRVAARRRPGLRHPARPHGRADPRSTATMRGAAHPRRHGLRHRSLGHPRSPPRPSSPIPTPSSSPTASGANRFPIRAGTDAGGAAHRRRGPRDARGGVQDHERAPAPRSASRSTAAPR